MLWTHFGISGPVAMDISASWIRHEFAGKAPKLHANLFGTDNFENTEKWFLEATAANHAKSVGRLVGERIPTTLVNALAEYLQLETAQSLGTLSKETRRKWVRGLIELPLPVHEHRGWNNAEVTSGGIPLNEMKPKTFESKLQPNLFLVGEILDCDGRIGGFNFQWAWSTGFMAAKGLIKNLQS